MSLTNINDLLNEAPDYEKEWFIGHIVAQDTTGQGRFKARIPELFDEGELPWIGFARSSPFGIGSGFGTYGTPALGSKALIRLQKGSPEHPICTGFLLLSSDVDPEFQNPQVWGFKDPSGNKMVVNMEANTWLFRHSSGTQFHIAANGRVTVQAQGYDMYGHATFHNGVDIKQGLDVEGGSELKGPTNVNGNFRQGSGTFHIESLDVPRHRHIDSEGGTTSEPF